MVLLMTIDVITACSNEPIMAITTCCEEWASLFSRCLQRCLHLCSSWRLECGIGSGVRSSRRLPMTPNLHPKMVFRGRKGADLEAAVQKELITPATQATIRQWRQGPRLDFRPPQLKWRSIELCMEPCGAWQNRRLRRGP